MVRDLAICLAIAILGPTSYVQTQVPPRWATGRDADRAPFAPKASPDHIVVMIGDDTARNDRRTVRRHGNWARVDTSDLQGSATYLVSLSAPVTVSFTRGEDGRYVYLHMTATRDGPSDNGPVRPTGETDHLLGETCAVWDITSRVMTTASDARWLSCITDDGIELWHRYESTNGPYRREMRAISLVRGTVAADVVTPPSDLLDPNRWAINWPSSPAQGVIVSLSDGDQGASRIEKRFARMGEIVRFDEPRRITVRDRSGRGFVAANIDAEGRYVSLTMSALPPTLDSPPPEPSNRDDLVPLTVDGESCAWSFMTPGVADYGRFECLTPEGDLLGERVHTRGGGSSVAAREVRRTVLSPTDVMLPNEVLDPANWALR
ncbi:hypothetical protein [Brevundimonas sp. GCM10030266]|uniref:hypothetical protein n=1 Tax=Brevundimonas sp. GCM10030266 TaxID=3273386 RepID=UPI003623234E